MAEALGIAAAAVQFLDVAARDIVKVSRLCSALRNAPDGQAKKAVELLEHFVVPSSPLGRHGQASFSRVRQRSLPHFEGLPFELVV